MSSVQQISFEQYLAAKKTVDDRSLNRYVWNRLLSQLSGREAPLQVVEVGAGTGTMIARVLDWGLFEGEVLYTAVDEREENIAEAHRSLKEWAVREGIETSITADTITFKTERCTLHARLQSADAFDYVETSITSGTVDLLIANAFIDLVNIPIALPRLFTALKPDGLFYFTITFDGITAFEPPIDPPFDELVESLYHADMEKRRWENHPSGGSMAGRRLLRFLVESGTEIAASGASDWIVTPTNGSYQADEALFLHFIIGTMMNALSGHPELDGGRFSRWIETRHQQIDEGKLIYIAHQLDVLGRL